MWECVFQREDYAPVAQGIEHRPPEAGAAVRIRPGVYFISIFQVQMEVALWKEETRTAPEAAGSIRSLPYWRFW